MELVIVGRVVCLLFKLESNKTIVCLADSSNLQKQQSQ